MATELRWQQTQLPQPQLRLVDTAVRRRGRGEYRGLEFLEVEAKKLINTLPSGPLPFRHTINVYRGCSHACTYCFARPTHDYLGLGIGKDFDTKIVVKINAVDRLRHEISPVRWAGEPIAMGTNTDPYQAAEGRYRLTRGVVEVLAEQGNPFSILTKSSLVLRDLDVLGDAARTTDVAVDFSIGTLDEDVWRLTEPGTPHPIRRIEAVRKLNEAGVATGVLMGPVLPGMSDGEEGLDAVVGAAVDAGAVRISAVLLHLKPGLRSHYFSFLKEHRPDLLDLHLERYGKRSYATKQEQAALTQLVRRLVRRHGGVRHVRRPAVDRQRTTAPPDPQLSLFDR